MGDSNKVAKKIKYAMRVLPDSIYIRLYYIMRFKKLPNLDHPKTYSEKLNWLKIHDHNPLYTKIVDKFEAKQYVSKLIGKEYIIPTLGIWNHFDEIEFDKLPDQFVLKCTHDSEGVVIVKDKKQFDKVVAKKKLEYALNQNFYYIGREWPYKNVKPRIIAEEYMEDHVDGELRDYKFFCFSGVPKIMFVASGRSSGRLCFDYFNMDFQHLDIIQDHPNAKYEIRKPINFDKMIELSKILSKNMPHVRIDFYEVNGNVYFGEITLYHHSGFAKYNPKEWDEILGSWIKLPCD